MGLLVSVAQSGKKENDVYKIFINLLESFIKMALTKWTTISIPTFYICVFMFLLPKISLENLCVIVWAVSLHMKYKGEILWHCGRKGDSRWCHKRGYIHKILELGEFYQSIRTAI